MTAFVLLHGFTGSPASWDDVVRELPAGAPVFAPALGGHGGPPAGSFDAEVDRLAGLVRQAGFAGARLAGYSMGARLGLGLLVRHPRLVRAATLVGVHAGLEPGPGREARAAEDDRWASRLEAEGIERFVRAWEAHPLLEVGPGPPPARREAWRRERLAHDARGLAAAIRALGPGRMPRLEGELGGIETPVRLVAGERDRKYLDVGRRLAALLPAGELRVVAGAGHNVLLEAPRALAELLLEGDPCRTSSGPGWTVTGTSATRSPRRASPG